MPALRRVYTSMNISPIAKMEAQIQNLKIKIENIHQILDEKINNMVNIFNNYDKCLINQKCDLIIKHGIAYIYVNGRSSMVKHLVGKHGAHMKNIQNTFGIKIFVPPKSKIIDTPIIVSPLVDCNVIDMLNALEFILNILNNIQM